LNVNEDELSGLNNLKNLTPDDSLCSFMSRDQDETPRPGVEEEREARGGRVQDKGGVSGASTPSLTRSHSTSSLYYEFGSAGVSPSPPPGIRTGRASAYSSYTHTPHGRASLHEPVSSWPLDYLNLDPMPPVPARQRAHDPKEVIIELLMDQITRASVRSRTSQRPDTDLSPLLQESPPRLGRSADHFNRQAWRRYLEQDPNASLLGQSDLNATFMGRANPNATLHSHFDPDATLRSHADPNATLMSQPDHNASIGSRGNSSRRSGRNVDIHLMRKALDLIEMLRSPSQSGVESLTGSSSSSSPEVYVSGQYRPPIVAHDRQRAGIHLPTEERMVASAYPPSDRLGTRGRPDSSAALRPGQSASLPSHYRPEEAPAHTRQLSQTSVVSTLSQSQLRRSLAGPERQGIYRYFVDSDSPITTPQWSNTPNLTPHITPAATPLQRYLHHNLVQQGPAPDLLLQSPLARQARGCGPVVYQDTDTRSHNRHRGHSVHVDMEDERARGESRERQRSGGGRSSLSSRQLEVLVDPDSGMHSDSQSAASRRQPLQSLDSNSPSLSPSSITHQPVTHHPQPLKGRSSSGTRNDNCSALSSSHVSLSLPRSPKASSSVQSRMLAATSVSTHRSGSKKRDHHALGDSGNASLSAKARSSDCLR
jgi:hypothetical protein